MTGPRRKHPEEALLHANCVAVAGRGVLILGPPGSGKSDLALRLIDAPGLGAGRTPLKALLVADDQVRIAARAGRLIASPPKTIAGLLEIRGVGIVRLPFRNSVALELAVRLAPAAEIERLPEPEKSSFEVAGLSLPMILLDPAAASAPARLRAALTRLRGGKADRLRK